MTGSNTMAREKEIRRETTLFATREEYGAKGKDWLHKADFNPVEVIVYKNGALAFSRASAEHFVYLYPSQKMRLLEYLKKRNHTLPRDKP
jgi:hypothetical protein